MAVQILSPKIRVSLSHSSPSLVTVRCSDVVAAPVSAVVAGAPWFVLAHGGMDGAVMVACEARCARCREREWWSCGAHGG